MTNLKAGSKGKAAMVAALSGVPTVIGAMAGYVLGDMGDLGLTLSLGFAAGSLMYVVFGEVLPQSIKLYCSRKTAFAAIVGVIVGIVVHSIAKFCRRVWRDAKAHREWLNSHSSID